MNVPATIKSLFDVVPLVTYKDERLPHKGPNYPFLEEFTVAVHNVFNCKGMIIPTDPISLGIVLVLAHKNKLAFADRTGVWQRRHHHHFLPCIAHKHTPAPYRPKPEHSTKSTTPSPTTSTSQPNSSTRSSIPSSMISGCCVYCVKILPPPFWG